MKNRDVSSLPEREPARGSADDIDVGGDVGPGAVVGSGSVRVGRDIVGRDHVEQYIEQQNIIIQQAAPAQADVSPPAQRTSLSAVLVADVGAMPEAPPQLIGRDDLLRDVHQLLDEGARVLLHGFGGIGKTALAASIAAGRIAAGQGPVLWVRAGHSDPDDLFETLARPFNRQQDVVGVAGEAQVQAMRGILAASGVHLLVVDDAWNGQALERLVRAIPPAMGLLVTSRQIYPVLRQKRVDQLSRPAALELLSFYAETDLASDPAAARLCTQLGDHPFALRVAALTMAVDALAADEMLQQIAGAPHDLAVPEAFAEPGHESIKALLDASVDALDETPRAVFRAFGGLFVPSVTPALMALCMRREPREINEALLTLQRRGLAQRARSAGGVAYFQVHDLAHAYARAMLDAREQVRQAVLQACRDYAGAHATQLNMLDAEQGNLLGAAEAARRSSQGELLVEIVRLLAVEGPYFTTRGYTPLALELLTAAVEAARAAGELETAHYLLSKLGNAYDGFLGDHRAALNAYTGALALARELGDRRREAIMLSILGRMSFHTSIEAAETYFQQALAAAAGDDFATAHILVTEGYCRVSQAPSDYEGAYRLFDRAVDITRRLYTVEQTPSPLLLELCFLALSNRGGCEHGLGQLDQALATHREAYEFARTQDHRYQMGCALDALGRVQDDRGSRSEAQQALGEALRIYREAGSLEDANVVIAFMHEQGYAVPD